MYTIIHKLSTFIAAGLLLAACSPYFDPGLSESGDQMLLEGVVAGGGTSWLSLSRVTPLGASHRDPTDFTIKEIEVKTGGRSIDVRLWDAQHWYFTETAVPGTVLDIHILTEDAGEIRASTTIPRAPEIKGVETELATMQGGDAAIQITLYLDEYIEPEDRFGLVVQREYTRVVIGPDGEQEDVFTYCTSMEPGSYAEDEYLDRLMQGRTRMCVPVALDGQTKDQMLLLQGRDFRAAGITALYQTLFDHEDMLEDGREILRLFRFRCRLYRLSPELYNYLAAQYNRENSYQIRYGLAPANYNYSNGHGGYGIFGALSAPAETPWLDNVAVSAPDSANE